MDYFIAALKRSGQHGIVNWLAQQIPNDVLHMNNCIHGWEHKQLQPMAYANAVHYVWNKTGENHYIKNFAFDWKIDIVKNRKLQQEFAYTNFSNVGSRIYNIEDFNLNDWNKHNFGSFEQLSNCKKILIVRDPFNFVASCLQRKIDPPDDGAMDVADQLSERMKLWKEYAKAAVEDNDYYTIKFNDWFSSADYRKKICLDLNLQFTDNGLKKVMAFGSGSSFDREKYDDNAQKMKVLERWKQYPDQQKLMSYIDKETKDISVEIFGEIL